MSENSTPIREQNLQLPNGEKRSFKVRSIKHRFKKGKGGALAGAKSQPAEPAKVIGQATPAKVEPPAK